MVLWNCKTNDELYMIHFPHSTRQNLLMMSIIITIIIINKNKSNLIKLGWKNFKRIFNYINWYYKECAYSPTNNSHVDARMLSE